MRVCVRMRVRVRVPVRACGTAAAYPAAWTVERVVEWAHMDAFGHVNHKVHLAWMEAGRLHVCERVRCAGIILAHAACSYYVPLTYPDAVTIRHRTKALGTTSWLLETRIVRRHAAQPHSRARTAPSTVLLPLARRASSSMTTSGSARCPCQTMCANAFSPSTSSFSCYASAPCVRASGTASTSNLAESSVSISVCASLTSTPSLPRPAARRALIFARVLINRSSELSSS